MVAFTVNGQRQELAINADTPLLWVLREHLKLTGTKFGCGIAACGACTVHIDGKATRSCATPVGMVDGKAVTTIEGLSADGSHPLQKAWIAEQVPQCGYCQSGQIMQAAELVATNKSTDARTDRRAHGRQYLSLRHLPEDHQRDPARGAGGLSHEQAHQCSRPEPPQLPQDHRGPDLRADARAQSARVHRRGRGRCAIRAERLAHDRHRRHHHRRVAGRRDGARYVHDAARDHRRRARRRLGQGQAGLPERLGRQEVRQPFLQPDIPDLRERFRVGLLHTVAHCGRTGAARAARRGRGEMGRTGRRAFDRAERRRAQGVRPPHRLRRDRGLRQGAGRDAEDRGKGPQADVELPSHRQGYCARRGAAQGHGRSEIRHGCAGARHGLRRGAAIALRRRRAADGRRRARAKSAGRHRHREAARRRRRHRDDGRRARRPPRTCSR